MSKKTDIELLRQALDEAEKRGIKNFSIVVNTHYERHCSVGIQEISISEITGMIIYAEGCDKDCIGYLPKKQNN